MIMLRHSCYGVSNDSNRVGEANYGHAIQKAARISEVNNEGFAHAHELCNICQQ